MNDEEIKELDDILNDSYRHFDNAKDLIQEVYREIIHGLIYTKLLREKYFKSPILSLEKQVENLSLEKRKEFFKHFNINI